MPDILGSHESLVNLVQNKLGLHITALLNIIYIAVEEQALPRRLNIEMVVARVLVSGVEAEKFLVANCLALFYVSVSMFMLFISFVDTATFTGIHMVVDSSSQYISM